MRTGAVALFLLVALIATSLNCVASDLVVDVAEEGQGIEWVKAGMVLDIGKPGEPDSQTAGGAFVLLDGNIYKMWYSGQDGAYIRIMYATSPDGLIWTKHGVVVDLGEPGDYDDEYLKEPSVLLDEQGTYQMWYTGQSRSHWGWRILYATSHDGINWEKHGCVFSKPDKSVAHPFVLIDGGIYRMWYSEYYGEHWRINYAESNDGLTWTDMGLAVDIGPPGAPDSRYVYEPGVIVEPEGTHIMYYSVFDGNPQNIVDVHYAVSTDGIGNNWKKKGLALRHGEEGDYDSLQILRPVVTMNPDGQHMLWYTGKEAVSGRMMLAVEKPKEIEATVNCGPQTLNLKSMGNWITCFIELPRGFDPRDIDAKAVLLNGIVKPELDPKYDFVNLEEEYITDNDADGVEERMVKFSRSEVQDILNVGRIVTLSISGKIYDGTGFSASYTIRVISPPEAVPDAPETIDRLPFVRSCDFADPLP